MAKERISHGQQRHFSLRSRLAALFLLLQLPLCLLQFYVYHWSNRSISREMEAAAVSYVEFLQSDLDETMSALVVQQEYLLVSRNLNAFLVGAEHMSNAEYYSQLENIMREMQSFLRGNQIVSSMSMYFPLQRQGLYVSLGHSDYALGSTDSLQPLEGHAFRISEEQLAALNERQKNRTSLLSFDGSNFILTYSKSLQQTGPYMVLEAVLNNEVLQERLNAFNTYPYAYTLLTHWDSRQVMGSDRDLDVLGTALPDAFFRSTGGEMLHTQMDYQGRTCYVLYSSSDPWHLTYVRLIDQAYLNAIPTRLQWLLAGFYTLLVITIVLYIWSTQRFFTEPIHNLMRCFGQVSQGKLDVQAKRSSTYEFDVLSLGFDSMTRHLRELIQKDYENTILLHQATLKQMQSQIQPHFLYNSFFMLRHTIMMEDLDKASSLCGYLGEFFQVITRQDQDFLPLEDEYAHMRNYLVIQQMRFEKRLELRLQPLPEEVRPMLVPRLVLQPLVENVFTHGMNSTQTVIQVSFQEDGGDLLVMVDDNGTGLTDERLSEVRAALQQATSPSSSHALGNIQQRLHLTYGEGYGLDLSRSPLGGLRVTMRLRPELPRSTDMEEETHDVSHPGRG